MPRSTRNSDESASLIEKDEEDWTKHKCFPMKADQRFYDTYVRPLVAEFFGTLILIYAGSMSQVSADLMIISNTHGLTLLFLVVIFGPISGGHVNPAVTIGVALTGSIGIFQSVFYILAQLAGSITGAALVKASLDASRYDLINGGTPGLGADVSVLKGTFMEAMITFMLVLVVLMTAIDLETTFAPIAIGFALTVGVASGGAVSGGSVNPARAFGPAVIRTTESTDHWTDHWIYWVGPILGTLAAAVLFRFVLASPKKRTVCRDEPDEEDEEHTLFHK